MDFSKYYFDKSCKIYLFHYSEMWHHAIVFKPYFIKPDHKLSTLLALFTVSTHDLLRNDNTQCAVMIDI